MPQEGIYFAQVKPQGRVTKASTGSPQVEVDCTVMHVWNPAAPNAQGGKGDWQQVETPYDIVLYLSMAENAAQYTIDKLKGLGFAGDFENPQFLNDKAKLQCRLDTYQGKQRMRWELYWRAASKPADAVTISRLDAMWRSLVEPAQGGPSAPPAAEPEAPPEEPGESETPF